MYIIELCETVELFFIGVNVVWKSWLNNIGIRHVDVKGAHKKEALSLKAGDFTV